MWTQNMYYMDIEKLKTGATYYFLVSKEVIKHLPIIFNDEKNIRLLDNIPYYEYECSHNGYIYLTYHYIFNENRFGWMPYEAYSVDYFRRLEYINMGEIGLSYIRSYKLNILRSINA